MASPSATFGLGRMAAQISLDALQRACPFALEMAPPRSGKQRFAHEAILNAQGFAHGRLQGSLDLGAGCPAKT